MPEFKIVDLDGKTKTRINQNVVPFELRVSDRNFVLLNQTLYITYKCD